jgi:hypothetical protein
MTLGMALRAIDPRPAKPSAHPTAPVAKTVQLLAQPLGARKCRTWE